MTADLRSVHQLAGDALVDYLKRITDCGDAFELRDTPRTGALEMLTELGQVPLLGPPAESSSAKKCLFCVPGVDVKKALVRSVYSELLAHLPRPARTSRPSSRLAKLSLTPSPLGANAEHKPPPPLLIAQTAGGGSSTLLYYFFCCCFQGSITPGGIFPCLTQEGDWLVTRSFVALLPSHENARPTVIAARQGGPSVIPTPTNYIRFFDLGAEPLHERLTTDDPQHHLPWVACGSHDQIARVCQADWPVLSLPNWNLQELQLAAFWCHPRIAKRDTKKLLQRSHYFGLNLKSLFSASATADSTPYLTPATTVSEFRRLNARLIVPLLSANGVPPRSLELRSFRDMLTTSHWASARCAELGKSWLEAMGIDESSLWASGGEALLAPPSREAQGRRLPQTPASDTERAESTEGAGVNDLDSVQADESLPSADPALPPIACGVLSPLIPKPSHLLTFEDHVQLPSPPPSNISPQICASRSALTPIAEETGESTGGDELPASQQASDTPRFRCSDRNCATAPVARPPTPNPSPLAQGALDDAQENLRDASVSPAVRMEDSTALQVVSHQSSPQSVTCAVIIESDEEMIALKDRRSTPPRASAKPRPCDLVPTESRSVVRNLVDAWEKSISPVARKSSSIRRKSSRPAKHDREEPIVLASPVDAVEAMPDSIDGPMGIRDICLPSQHKKRRCSGDHRLVILPQSAPLMVPDSCEDAELYGMISECASGNEDDTTILERDIRLLKHQMELAARQWRMCEAALGTMTLRLKERRDRNIVDR